MGGGPCCVFMTKDRVGKRVSDWLEGGKLTGKEEPIFSIYSIS